MGMDRPAIEQRAAEGSSYAGLLTALVSAIAVTWLVAVVALPAISPATAKAAAPGVLALAQARARYLELVEPLNARFHAAGDRIGVPSDPATVRAIDLEYAAIESDMAAGLRRMPFPSGLVRDATALAAAADRVATLNRRLADAAPEDVLELGAQLSDALDVQRAYVDELRSALGLPAAT